MVLLSLSDLLCKSLLLSVQSIGIELFCCVGRGYQVCFESFQTNFDESFSVLILTSLILIMIMCLGFVQYVCDTKLSCHLMIRWKAFRAGSGSKNLGTGYPLTLSGQVTGSRNRTSPTPNSGLT